MAHYKKHPAPPSSAPHYTDRIRVVAVTLIELFEAVVGVAAPGVPAFPLPVSMGFTMVRPGVYAAALAGGGGGLLGVETFVA